jgi:hypothetical protein
MNIWNTGFIKCLYFFREWQDFAPALVLGRLRAGNNIAAKQNSEQGKNLVAAFARRIFFKSFLRKELEKR